MNKFMPLLSIFSFLSFFTYAVAAIKWPNLVLESFEGWPFSEGWRNTKVRWPQRIWGICAFIGFVVMVVFVVHGMWNWLPDSSDSTDDNGDASDGKDVWVGLLSLVGSIGGMWMLVGFARLRFENESLKYMVFQMREVLLGTAWKRQSVVQDIKKGFTEKPTVFSNVFRIYDLHDAKEEVLRAVAELTENVKKESDQKAEARVRENCEKEKCSAWVKRIEKEKKDEKENRLFMEKIDIEIEGKYSADDFGEFQEREVKEIILETLGVKAEQVKNKAFLTKDLGADSNNIKVLMKAFEKHFDLTIPNESAARIKTVGDAVKYIQKYAEKYDLSEEKSVEIAEELVLLKEHLDRVKDISIPSEKENDEARLRDEMKQLQFDHWPGVRKRLVRSSIEIFDNKLPLISEDTELRLLGKFFVENWVSKIKSYGSIISNFTKSWDEQYPAKVKIPELKLSGLSCKNSLVVVFKGNPRDGNGEILVQNKGGDVIGVLKQVMVEPSVEGYISAYFIIWGARHYGAVDHGYYKVPEKLFFTDDDLSRYLIGREGRELGDPDISKLLRVPTGLRVTKNDTDILISCLGYRVNVGFCDYSVSINEDGIIIEDGEQVLLKSNVQTFY